MKTIQWRCLWIDKDGKAGVFFVNAQTKEGALDLAKETLNREVVELKVTVNTRDP